MLKHRQFLYYTLLLGFIVSISPTASLAQSRNKKDNSKIVLDSIDYDLKKGQSGLKVIAQTAGVKAQGIDDKWGVIDVTYATPQEDWLDEVEFRYHVMVHRPMDKRKKQRSVTSILSGSVTYIDVFKANELHSAMYIHPVTLARYGEAKVIHVEVWLDGRMLMEDTLDLRKSKERKKIQVKDNWWTQARPIEDRLLNRMQTPFILSGLDGATLIKAAS